MLKFLKNFGLGLLYVLLFPFILVGVVIFALDGFISCLFELVAILIRFFRGEKIFPPFPEDVRAQEILAKNFGTKEETPAQPQPTTQNVYVQQNYYPNPNGPMMGQQNPALGNPQYQQPYQQMPPYQQPPYLQNPYLGQNPAAQQIPQEQNPYGIGLNQQNPAQQPEPALIEKTEEEAPFSAEEYRKGENDDQ